MKFSGAWARLGETTDDLGEGEVITTYSIQHPNVDEHSIEQIDVRDLSGASSYQCDKDLSLGLAAWVKSLGCKISAAKPTKFGAHAALSFDIVSCTRQIRGRGLAVCDVSKLGSRTAHGFRAVYISDASQYSDSKAAAFLATFRPL